MIWLPYTKHRRTDRMIGAPALELHDLTVGYPGAPGPALDAVSLRLPAGVRAALVGANGSGKSTLLKTAAGLIHPGAGTVRIYGQPVGSCHHRVAYLPQRSEIDWRFPVTLERLVLAGRYVHLGWMQRPGRNDRLIVAETLGRLGLSDLTQRQISQLSGGQQQRALLARALVQDADLLLLDEPLSAVDTISRQIITGVLDELRSAGKSALVATHHLDRIEEEYDQVFTLVEGSLQAEALYV